MKLHEKSFVHEKAVVLGEVELVENVSVWPCAVIRADEGLIKVGKNSNIQDNCVLHGKTTIGENCTLGHSAVVHGCTLGNNVLVGMNATILSGAIIGDNVIIAAGSVVRENQEIPSNSLAAGVPAKIKRELTEQDLELISHAFKEYLKKIKK